MADLSEFHDELRAVARDVLGKPDSGEPLGRNALASTGWLGLEVPADVDGADATFAEVAVILREMGRAATIGPYPAVAALAVGALTLLDASAARDALLADTVSGATIPVLVLGGDTIGDSTCAGDAAFRFDRTPAGWSLTGAASFVLDAPGADRLLVPAVDPDGTVTVVAVDPATPGLTCSPQHVVDATRSFGRVVADGVAVDAASVWTFRGDSRAALQRLHDRAAIAVACDSLGVSEAMLDATVDYVGVREQFGRPVGSFQAVKHACADMLVRVTLARTLVDAAVRAEAEDAADRTVAASMAKAHACAAAVDIAGKAMQLHGGIGYTWESGVHVYLKRATLNRSLFGSPAEHRARLSRRYREAVTG